MDNPENANAPKPNVPDALIWWVIWSAFLVSSFMFYLFLHRPDAENTGFPFDYIPVLPFFGAVIVRLFILPRVVKRDQKVVAFIVGLAMAEAVLMKGLFLAPEYAMGYLFLSVAGLALYNPLTVRNFGE